jgi:hypothetical protein
MRTPTFAELKRFCEQDRWDSKRRTDHWRFTKKMPDGTLARTKVSFGAGQLNDPKLFAAILREQLRVSADEFWRVVDRGGPAIRPLPITAETPAELPAWLVGQLMKEGVKTDVLKGLSKDDAKALLVSLRSRPRP